MFDVKIGAERPIYVVKLKRYHEPEVLAQSFFIESLVSLQNFSNPEDETYLTEIIIEEDRRASSYEIGDAEKAEIRNPLARETFKVVIKEDTPINANVVLGRLVLAINYSEDDKVKFQACYVAGGHRNRYKNVMVHSATTLQPHSDRLSLAIGGIFGFDV